MAAAALMPANPVPSPTLISGIKKLKFKLRRDESGAVKVFIPGFVDVVCVIRVGHIDVKISFCPEIHRHDDLISLPGPASAEANLQRRNTRDFVLHRPHICQFFLFYFIGNVILKGPNKNVPPVQVPLCIALQAFSELIQLLQPLNGSVIQIIGGRPLFYDLETFNSCETSGALLLTLEAWAGIHPSLVTLPVEWDFTVPYGLLFSRELSEDAASFLDIIKNRS